MPPPRKRFKKSPIELIEQLKYDGGLTYKKIAEKLNRSVSTIYRIRKGKTSFKTADKYYKDIAKVNKSKHLRVTKNVADFLDVPKFDYDYMLIKFTVTLWTDSEKKRITKDFFISCSKRYYPAKAIEFKRALLESKTANAVILNIQTFPKQFRKSKR